MSDSFPESQENAELPRASSRPAELPPVEPPSAKFIVQLFVVPGVIVAIIVGAWLLFGKLASSEQDWQSLLADMKSTNEHRRGRGAMGLAQTLAADAHTTSPGPRLATNPQVAQELSGYMAELLKSSSPEPKVIDEQAFMARTLGLLDVPDVVLPVLCNAVQPTRDREVRKNALLAIALIAFRAYERGAMLTDERMIDDIVIVARDSDQLFRCSAAFTLGFFPAAVTKQPLTVLLADSDAKTRYNAASAFARQKSLDGLPVIREVLTAAASGQPTIPGSSGANDSPAPANDGAGVDWLSAVRNSLQAIYDLEPLLDPTARGEIERDVQAISKSFFDPRLRLDAVKTLNKLRGDRR